MPSKPYQGHKNWNHWNVSLWLNNDETLYRSMLRYVSIFGSKDQAAKCLFQDMVAGSIDGTYRKQTPDGAPYTISAIRSAMRGL